jgi:hypothetical protein
MKHDDEATLIAATFDALNEGTLRQAERRLDSFIYREPAQPLPKALDVADHDESEMWEAWWQGERHDAVHALRHLAQHKRLHADDVDTYTYLVKHGHVTQPTFTQPRRGRVQMEFTPRFKDVATLVAYVLLRLSVMHERIVVCPAPKVGEPDAECGRLVLDKPHVGHPLRFCSIKCRNRFNAQRSRSKARTPAKPKARRGK